MFCSYEAVGGAFGPILEFPPQCGETNPAEDRLTAAAPSTPAGLICNLTGGERLSAQPLETSGNLTDMCRRNYCIRVVCCSVVSD